MTTFTRIFNLLTLLLIMTTGMWGQSAEKTLVKSFAVEKHQTVVIDTRAPVEIREWEGELLRVQMTISLQQGSEAVLKSLISAGRYNLVMQDSNNIRRISAPNLAREVQIGGKVLEDKVTLLIMSPRNITVTVVNQTAETISTGTSL
jgi:hypothetical protein